LKKVPEELKSLALIIQNYVEKRIEARLFHLLISFTIITFSRYYFQAWLPTVDPASSGC